jgi:hypothetical protein
MRPIVAAVVALTLTATARAADPPPASGLSPEEAAEGWVMLYDGQTTYGWKTEGDVAVKDGALTLGGERAGTATTTSGFGRALVKWAFAQDGNRQATMTWRGEKRTLSSGGIVGETYEPAAPGVAPITLHAPAGTTLIVRRMILKPQGLTPIFNGKDLTGWKVYPGDKSRKVKSVFTVTPEGWINVKNGPGDLQTTGQYQDFILQVQCISNGRHLNSGVFFRCLPDQYQNGYEAQVQNGFKDNDRTKPEDYGTGAIYRRQPARKVVSDDHEWFTMTVLAEGNHIATWVNGYQTTDFTDTRPPNDNARNGAKTGAGAISIQGHDPTTDLSFRNLRLAEWKK